MIVQILSLLLGVLMFLFFFWKQLKDDYIRNQIFSTAFSGLLFLGVGYFISFKYFGNLRFWLSLVGAVAGFAVGVVKYKLKILEVFEAAVLGLLSLFTVIFIGTLFVTGKIIYLFSFVVLTLLFILFHLLEKYYKGFTWYKSGRIGFAGLTVSGVFFLVYTIVAITLGSMISFVSNRDYLISFFLAILSFSFLVKLAKQKT